MKERCQADGCMLESKYALYKTFPDGRKIWLQVCKKHEEEIGTENVRRYLNKKLDYIVS